MFFLDIPYATENNRIAKEQVKKELESLNISETSKSEALAAIYHLKPRGIMFENKDLPEAQLMERLFLKLGIPFRLAEMSEFA